MNGYKDLMFEFKLTFDDPWGDTLEWWFATAETLYHAGEDIPEEWEFRDSPMHASEYEPEGYAAERIADLFMHDGGLTTDELFRFGRVLARYAQLLKKAGKDY